MPETLLAIGFHSEENSVIQVEVTDTDDAQSVANQLHKQFKIWFEQILLIESGDLIFDGPVSYVSSAASVSPRVTSPKIIHHWILEFDYEEVAAK